jgi:hypothetical protein
MARRLPAKNVEPTPAAEQIVRNSRRLLEQLSLSIADDYPNSMPVANQLSVLGSQFAVRCSPFTVRFIEVC